MKAVQANEKLANRIALSPDEIRAMAGIGRNTVYNALASGELKGKRIGKKRWVVPVDEVLRWINEA